MAPISSLPLTATSNHLASPLGALTPAGVVNSVPSDVGQTLPNTLVPTRTMLDVSESAPACAPTPLGPRRAPLSNSMPGQLPSSQAIPELTNQLTSQRGRQLKRSQRAEQMDRIGANLPAGKENMPVAKSNNDPGWLKEAKEYLEQQDFGGEWAACVAAWLTLELKQDKKVFDDAQHVCKTNVFGCRRVHYPSQRRGPKNG